MKAKNTTKPLRTPGSANQPATQSVVRPPRRADRGNPILRFSPTAWAKLLFFRDRGETEIGGFAVTPVEDPLYVEEFVPILQTACIVSVRFDDNAVADHFEAQVDAGRRPEQFARTWLHTHPGDSPEPSVTDEETFDRVFGDCDWAIMFILAKTGRTYARLRFGVGPGGEVMIPVEVDYSRPFGASDFKAWAAEYEATVHPIERTSGHSLWHGFEDEGEPPAAEDWLDDFETLDEYDQRTIIDELACRAAFREIGEVS